MSTTLPVAIDIQSQGLSQYMQQINDAPILSVEEERALATRLRDHEDLEAARKLVFSHLRYVIGVARGFMGYGLPIQDLIQEGNIGLMKAVKRFDPDRDVRLVSFAVHWIRAEIYDYVVRNWRIVKVATTKAQRKLFFNLRKSRNRLDWMKSDEVDALADRLDVDTNVVKEMESRLSGTDVSFDPVYKEEDELAPSPSGYLADSSNDPALVMERADHIENRNANLAEAMASLDDRSRDIIQRRWLNDDDKPTLSDLADEYGVSAERIRQIEKKAMQNMKTALAA